MKNNYLNFRSAVLGICLVAVSQNVAIAGQVPQKNAKKVAENFFRQHSDAETITAELKYTALDAQGSPAYYAFNINNNSGFVIVSAEDAGKPIIGYSTEEGFKQPDPRSTTAVWLAKRTEEINYLRKNHITPTNAINAKWNEYATAQTANKTSSSGAVAPLLSTKWNQSPFYNDSCPGGSVTGCVATTMAQIMKYWSYPAKGTGSSSYCDCTSGGFSNNFGILKANYGAATYNWNNMPNQSGPNGDVAKIMYHCGVSVEMDYDPAGSGAWVINSDSPVSAEHAYIAYFKYDQNTILGVNRSDYSDNVWMSMVKNDIDLGRPIQYVGFGSSGGHTWVCDGYDQNDFLHMNWGWGGSGNGYFDVDVLNPSGMDFSGWQQGLFGILPIATDLVDAGIVSISPTTNGCTGNQYAPIIKVRNYGINNLTSFTINYKLDNGTVQTLPWTGSLVTGQTAIINLANYNLSNGAHAFTCFVSNPNNSTDANTGNDQSVYNFAVYSADNLPIVEGFENVSVTNTHWSIIPSTNGSDWAFTGQSFSGGSKSLMVDNLNNTAGNVSILKGLNTYDFSNTNDPAIYFKVAYQRKSFANNDKLQLQISNDCGNTWWTKWSKQGAALATTTVLSSTAFVPAVADYVEYEVPGVMSANNIFRWVFTADATAPGNNIYLDDINILDKTTVGIKENKNLTNGFELFPNPGSGETFMSFNLINAASVEINVTDILGKKVIALEKTNYNSGNQTISFNKENTLSKGIYMVTISVDGAKSTKKLIIN